MAYEDKDVEGDKDADNDSTTVSKKEWPDVHSEALLAYERDFLREQSNIDDAYEDLRFRRGRLSDQWTPEALQARQGRPCHVVNKLPQFIRQVTGDMRQMRPSIKVVPVDSGADIKVAEVRGGIIRYVENRSNAKYIYTTAGDSQVTCGIGHWQITTEYADAGTFNQEIRVAGIEDSVSVLWDADSVMPTRDDAQHCFVPVDMSTAAFKKKWPDAVASGFDVRLTGTGTSGAFDNWHSDDYIRVVQHWCKKPIKRTLALMPDGSIEDLTDQVKDVPKEHLEAGLNFLRQQKQARIEERDSYKICRYLLTMAEVLEESEWPGMYIPVVPVLGEEVRIGREVYRHGIVRYARDLQRMVNYYSSAETEVIALQPKAPWIGTKKMFQDHYDLWQTANTDNHPFLEYTVDPSAAGGKPERVQPPVPSQAIQAGSINAANDMEAVIGIYKSALGAKSNEVSGIAIKRRDQQSDTGTFVYQDNFALGIQRTGQIINDLIPHIYDTQRQLRILGEDGKPDVVDINKPYIEGGEDKIQHDVTVGSYDVMIEQGPSYATKREEAKDGMTAFIQAVPAAAGLIGDLYAESQDWPNAQAIGERLQEMLPPPVKAKLEADKQQREQASGKPPAPPSPEQQQQMAAQQKQQQMAEQAQQLQMAEVKAKTDEQEAKARKANAEADKIELEVQMLKATLAQSHMEELRKIESHDHDMARGQVEHDRSHAHAMDKHGADMTTQGLAAGNAIAQAMQGGEKHGAAMEQMNNPPEPQAPAQ